MEVSTIDRASDLTKVEADPIAEELRNARTLEERTRILAPCVTQVIIERGLDAELAYPSQEKEYDTGIHQIVSDARRSRAAD